MRSFAAIVVTILLGAAAAPAAEAGSILGTRTFAAAEDLTAIQTTTGNVWEWLDLSVTDGLSVQDALNQYSTSGFRWANGAEVAELYDAFGIGYTATSGARVSLNAQASAMESFVGYLGFTVKDDPFLRTAGALGWIDDLTTSTNHTFSCLSVSGGCSPFSFVENTTQFWGANSRMGVYLVREQPAVNVPEPGSLLLFGVGCAALAARFRSRAIR